MMRLLTFIGVCTTITGCDEIPLPKVEVCTVLSSSVICTDKRLSGLDQEYIRPVSYIKTFQCIGPHDYQIIMNDVLEKRRELLKLRAVFKKGLVK